jgi:hypothetical protein
MLGWAAGVLLLSDLDLGKRGPANNGNVLLGLEVEALCASAVVNEGLCASCWIHQNWGREILGERDLKQVPLVLDCRIAHRSGAV